MHVEVIPTEDLGDRSYLVHDGTSAVVVDPQRDVARTDELTRAQYHSARRLAAELPDATPVYPTHGFGSFCSSGAAAGGDGGTIGQEKTRNDALVTDDEDAFVETLIANLTAYPAYYAHMGGLNRSGPAAPDLSPPTPLQAEQLRTRIDAGEWVVDLRDRTAYAASHVHRSVGVALGQQFSTYLGWLMPWGTPLTLIGESAEQVAEARRMLVRIGIDELQGSATGYIPGAAHVPMHQLLANLDTLPPGQLWVHCASGYRASIAASLLDRAGRDVVFIDDSFDSAVAAGLTTSP